MKKVFGFAALVAWLAFAACTNSGYKKTKTGLEYKIFENGTGAKAKKGE